ncbi:MAG TPA: hypothetical protein VKU19_37905 [Bryobacteraceae bacterium]|nr:hypothetical protein [Bryobacteraceae bacterium]
MSDVLQLEALSQLFQEALDQCRPRSVAVLGVAGGNGLERIDPAVTTRVVGLDVNLSYLNAVKRRFGQLPGLELHEVDLTADLPQMPRVELVHAALIFEHAGVGRALENALSLVEKDGHFSVVLQPVYGRPGPVRIRDSVLDFSSVDPTWFRNEVESRGLKLLHERRYPVPSGEFWAAIFGGPVPRSDRAQRPGDC